MQASYFKNLDLILLTKISGRESQLQRLFLTQNPKQNSCDTDNYLLPHSATIRLVVGGSDEWATLLQQASLQKVKNDVGQIK